LAFVGIRSLLAKRSQVFTYTVCWAK